MKKTHLLLLVGVLFTALSLQNARAASDYTIADLESLAHDSMWAELLDKAKTVHPSDRTAEWKDLVTKAAVADLAALSGTSEDAGAHAKALLDSYPFIAENADIKTKISTVMITNLNQCLDGYDTSICQTDFAAFVKKNPSLNTLALKGAKAMALKLNRNQLAPAFETAVLADKASCKDDDLELSVIGGLQMPTSDDAAKSAKRIATLCKPELDQKLEQQYGKELKQSYYRQNTCDYLGKSCD